LCKLTKVLQRLKDLKGFLKPPFCVSKFANYISADIHHSQHLTEKSVDFSCILFLKPFNF
jgi:hypothetical protein